jgi:DNA-binding MarR family transcriptional regulator
VGIAGSGFLSSAVETREQIFQYIKGHPGTHLRQVKRDLNISMGVTQYHLYTLEKERKILSRRNGLYKRFYPTHVFREHQQEILDVLSQETERDLLLYLLQNPGSGPKELCEFARMSPGTINWHMKRLIGSNLVMVRREGQFVKYKAIDESTEIISLVQSYHPSSWQQWVDRFANAISEVSASPEGGQEEEMSLGEVEHKEKEADEQKEISRKEPE